MVIEFYSRRNYYIRQSIIECFKGIVNDILKSVHHSQRNITDTWKEGNLIKSKAQHTTCWAWMQMLTQGTCIVSIYDMDFVYLQLKSQNSSCNKTFKTKTYEKYIIRTQKFIPHFPRIWNFIHHLRILKKRYNLQAIV